MSKPVSVLFVCLGNICRSPTAQGVFQKMVDDAGLSEQIITDSAGTSDWHLDEAPDPRTVTAASRRGYDLSQLRGRQAQRGDFARFDYIFAMDNSNLQHLQRLAPADFAGHLGLFLDFCQGDYREVPDPYHGGRDGFTLVLDLIEEASGALLQDIQRRHLSGAGDVAQ